MRFRVLGPLEVSDGERPIHVAGRKQRALLCALLLEANHVISVDELVDRLWDDEPPETAAKAVQVYVSQLRKSVGARLERRGGGYVIGVERGELDLLEFLELTERGEYHAALRLWRGAPLAELARHRFGAAEIARLEELRLSCLERRLDADLAAGHDDLVGELERLVRAHPLREHLRGQLMLALYRAGRQAEALEAFQNARGTLVEELGIEPGRALRNLHQRILNQDPTLDADGVAERTDVAEEPAPAVVTTDRETRKTVTVLSAILAARATDGRSLDPEALRYVVGRAAAEVRGAVERHGGAVVTDGGDLLTAIFGIPAVHEDDARRALRAASEIGTACHALAAEVGSARRAIVRVSVGISTGEVVVGGDMQPAGEPLFVATGLARGADAGQALFDARTYRVAHEGIDAEIAGEGFLLLGARRADESRGVRRRAPMIGRTRELRRLRETFAQAVADDSCHLFTILGPAGVGKSRLVDEFLAYVDGAHVCQGRCLPYGEGITYWPVLEAVRDAVGIEDDDSPDEAMRRLSSALAGEDDGERLARRIADLIGLSDGVLAAEDGIAAVRILLERLAHDRPLIVVFDDIHWGEPVFLDLVEHLADWTREAPVLVICLARPELLDSRSAWAGGKLNATSILLEPLSADESGRLIDHLDGDTLDEQTREQIVAAAEGNPLFVEEMLALALDGDAAGKIAVPPTIQALLVARLDRLGQDERSVLERAAVMGKVFYEEAIAELGGAGPASTPATLASLVRKQLIRPDRSSLGSRTYRFRHLLIRDAAYDSIPKHARAELHKRFGLWLEQAASDRRTEYEEVVGYHLEQASRFLRDLGVADDQAQHLAREAATRLGTAGRRAFVRSDAPAGVNLVSRAVALLPPEDLQRVELVPNVRVVQGMRGDLEWADRVLTEAVEAAATSGDRRLAAHALVQRALLRLFTEPTVKVEELLDVARRAADVFTELDDRLGLARACRLEAQAHYLARRGGACTEASERALTHALAAGDIFEQREILEWLAIALFVGPTPAEDAVRQCEQLLGRTRGDPVSQVHILGAQAYLLAMLERADEAAEQLARGHALMEQLGEWIWVDTWHKAAIHLWEGRASDAEDEIRPAYEALKRLGERSHFSTMAHALAAAAYMQGRYDEAEQLTHECEAVSGPNDVYSGIIWRSTRAKVLARHGRHADAIALAAEAVSLAFAGDFYVGTAEALMDLSEVHELAGHAEAAADAIEQALEFHALKGNLLAARRARRRLAELQALAQR